MLQKLAWILGFIIFAGFFWPNPDIPASVGGSMRVLAWIAAIAPTVPLVAAAILNFTHWRLPVWVTCILVGLWLPCALLPSLFRAGISGGGFMPSLVHGLGVTLLGAASFLMLTKPGLLSAASRTGLALLTVPAAIGTWSLISAGLVAWEASRISGDRAYCLAVHGERKPVPSIASLRGLAFYTTHTGYKTENRWFFNAVLIVQEGERREVFNWSARRMRFDRVASPERLYENPALECEPRQGFLLNLPII